MISAYDWAEAGGEPDEARVVDEADEAEVANAVDGVEIAMMYSSCDILLCCCSRCWSGIFCSNLRCRRRRGCSSRFLPEATKTIKIWWW